MNEHPEVKLTRQAIKALLNAEVDVKLWNGTFKIAKVVASFNRYRLELSVAVTHPLMEKYSKNNYVELALFKSPHSGLFIKVPEELQPLIENMKLAATMTDEEVAGRIKTINNLALEDAITENIHPERKSPAF